MDKTKYAVKCFALVCASGGSRLKVNLNVSVSYAASDMPCEMSEEQ